MPSRPTTPSRTKASVGTPVSRFASDASGSSAMCEEATTGRLSRCCWCAACNVIPTWRANCARWANRSTSTPGCHRAPAPSRSCGSAGWCTAPTSGVGRLHSGAHRRCVRRGGRRVGRRRCHRSALKPRRAHAHRRGRRTGAHRLMVDADLGRARRELRRRAANGVADRSGLVPDRVHAVQRSGPAGRGLDATLARLSVVTGVLLRDRAGLHDRHSIGEREHQQRRGPVIRFVDFPTVRCDERTVGSAIHAHRRA